MNDSFDPNPPIIQVPEITAGLILTETNCIYEVPACTFSVLYIAQLDGVTVEVDDQIATVAAGDIVAMPRGSAHRLYLAGQRNPQRIRAIPAIQQREQEGSPPNLAFCCRVPVSANPLPDVVPNLITLTRDRQKAEGRLDLAFKLLMSHALDNRRDRNFMLRKLGEVAATTILGTILDDIRASGVDLERAADDPHVRRAINAVHSGPNLDWDLESLAREAGLARSTFAERFRTVIGVTPMAYLADQRLAYAANVLRDTQLSVVQTAEKVGYNSDSAFAKAFKRKFGVSPREYRQNAKSLETSQD